MQWIVVLLVALVGVAWGLGWLAPIKATLATLAAQPDTQDAFRDPHTGRTDALIMRVVDVFLAIPYILLAMGVVFALGPSLVNVILVMAATRWVQFARIVRADVLSIREREFVSGARARGNRSMRLLLRHVLPNALTPIIVVATLELAFMIIYESALSFLGLGVQPPTPTWGWMLADGRNYIATAWWLATFPGLAIMLTVLAVNLLGDWLRDTLDPRLKV